MISLSRIMGAGRTRRRKTPSLLRSVIAKNVTTRARRIFPVSKNLPMDIRKASGDHDLERLTKSTIQRIISAETSATLEQIALLAQALELSPYQLLIPDLDSANPQLAKGATADEQSLYMRIAQQAVKETLAAREPALSRRIRRKS